VPEDSERLRQPFGLFLSGTKKALPTNLLLLLLWALYVPSTLLALVALKWRADACS